MEKLCFQQCFSNKKIAENHWKLVIWFVHVLKNQVDNIEESEVLCIDEILADKLEYAYLVKSENNISFPKIFEKNPLAKSYIN